MLKRLISYLKCINLMDNIYGYRCPNCMKTFQHTTATVNILWDEKYKVYKKYIKCNECLLTTPAFVSLEEAKDNWEYYWIKKEDEILLS